MIFDRRASARYPPAKREEWDMRYLAAVMVVLALTVPSIADAAPHCVKGKPCGNSCISKDKVCHKGG